MSSRGPQPRRARWLIALLALVVLHFASHIPIPGRPVQARTAFWFVLGYCVLLLVLTATMSLLSVLPGRRARARITEKRMTTPGGGATTRMSITAVTLDRRQVTLQISSADYAGINVGDEGILSYRHNEFRGFSRAPLTTDN